MLRRELPSGAYLRLFEESDADELFALTDRNRSHLAAWLPWVPAIRSAQDSLEFIRTTRRLVGGNAVRSSRSSATARSPAWSATTASTGSTVPRASATGWRPTRRAAAR